MMTSAQEAPVEDASLVTVSPGWLLGAAIAIITAVASGVLWLANRFSKVEIAVEVLSSEVKSHGTDLQEVKTTVTGHDKRIRDVEIGLAKFKGPTRRMAATAQEE